MKEIRFYPENIICDQGEISNRLYFIISGNINLYISNKSKLVNAK